MTDSFRFQKAAATLVRSSDGHWSQTMISSWRAAIEIAGMLRMV